MTFFLTNNFFILSGILVLTHAGTVTAGTVTGSPANGKTDFTKNNCSEEIVDEKKEAEDDWQVTVLQLLHKKKVVIWKKLFKTK